MTYTVVFTLPSPELDCSVIHVAHVTATSADHALQRVNTGIPKAFACIVFGGDALPLKLVHPSKMWVL